MQDIREKKEHRNRLIETMHRFYHRLRSFESRFDEAMTEGEKQLKARTEENEKNSQMVKARDTRYDELCWRIRDVARKIAKKTGWMIWVHQQSRIIHDGWGEHNRYYRVHLYHMIKGSNLTEPRKLFSRSKDSLANLELRLQYSDNKSGYQLTLNGEDIVDKNFITIERMAVEMLEDRLEQKAKTDPRAFKLF